MKVGDLVRKKGINRLVGIVLKVGKQSLFGHVALVAWPGCDGFWTDISTLEVVNENR